LTAGTDKMARRQNRGKHKAQVAEQSDANRHQEAQISTEENGDVDEDCRCEVDRLTVSTISQPDVVVNPTTGTTDILRNAWFVAYFRHNGCCDCCQFRQYIRGFAELNGVSVSPPVPGFNFSFWKEDQDSNNRNFGHREQPAEVFNRYVPDQGDGCIYLGQDAPGFYGLHPGDKYFVYFEFADFVIDTCNDDAVAAGPEFWDLIDAGTVA
jgi:hypothetical protein